MEDQQQLFTQKRGYLHSDFKVFHIKDQKNIEFDYHHHDFNKIIVFLSGNVTYFIEGKAYELKPWDVLFISSDQLHKPVIDSSTIYERMIIWFNPDVVKKHDHHLLSCFDMASEKKFNRLRLKMDSLEKFQAIVTQLMEEEASNDFGSETYKHALIVQLVIHLNRLFFKHESSQEMSDVKYDEKIEDVIAYIHDHLQGDLTIDHLASQFFISKYHLMRKFKAQTGGSIHYYVQQKRMIHAKSLIKDGRSMMEVSLECGFKDYSSFVRAFKKMYGLSPKNYYKRIFDV